MSIIALKGVPEQWNLVEVVKAVAKLVGGPFEPLNFAPAKNQKKTCYIRISEKLDPIRVVERISSATIGPKALRFIAYVPEEVPDLPLFENNTMPKKQNKRGVKSEKPHQVVLQVHQEVFMELQYRYPGLYNLSRKTGHKLLDEIAKTLAERLIRVTETNPKSVSKCFLLSKVYRVKHPHSGDFALVESTLHRLQDAAGAPRLTLDEAQLEKLEESPMIENVRLDNVKDACKNFKERMMSAIKEHVASLNTVIEPGDTEEVIARKKVREELKKMMPFMPAALKQVVTTHFLPEEQPYRKIRIYGSPFLPGREAMQPFTARYNRVGSRVMRSKRIYNLLMFKVDTAQYAALKAMDATVINGAKLTIRSDVPYQEVNLETRKQIASHFGVSVRDFEPMDEEEDDFEEDIEIR